MMEIAYKCDYILELFLAIITNLFLVENGSAQCSGEHHLGNVSRVLSYQGLSYDVNSTALQALVDNLLRQTAARCQLQLQLEREARAVIVPHANFDMSGDIAAMAYVRINVSRIRRVFALGPSHNFNFDYCMLSPATAYQVPYDYELLVDQEVYADLMATNRFRYLDYVQDELEHCIEDLLPILGQMLENLPLKPTIVPIITGDFTYDEVAHYGRIFAPYLSSPHNLFVISSDFCHWGNKYNFTYLNGTAGVRETIEGLDKLGMAAIETMNPSTFDNYVEKYGNTICGEESIRILMHMATNLSHLQPAIRFVDYKVSENCNGVNDTCVSYAAAVLTFHNES